jgi:hypothetical protein
MGSAFKLINFSRSSEIESPAEDLGTMNPWIFPSRLAYTRIVSASLANGTNAFSPVRIYSSPLIVATVLSAFGSKSYAYSMSAAVYGLHSPLTILGR